jgi:3-oxoacyl-[acyl-carrier-protein] synthase III
MSSRMVIENIGVYIPENSLTTAEVVAPCSGVSAAIFERITGVLRRPIAGPNEFSIDLARKAVDRCLRSSRLAPDSIGWIICCNISSYDGQGFVSLEPARSLKLKREFGLKNATALDISNACAGVFTALYLADILLRGGPNPRALVVSGEHSSHAMRTAQLEIRGLLDPRLACLTLGDSGVAMTLELSDEPEIGFQMIDLFTMGKFSELCIGRHTDREHGGAIMYTNSGALRLAAMEYCLPHTTNSLVEHRWDPETIDAFFCHQSSKLALDTARAALNSRFGRSWLHEGNFVNTLQNRGNLATNSHFVSLWDVIGLGRIPPRSRVVFLVAASGLTGGTALYTFDDLPERIRSPAQAFRPESNQPGPALNHDESSAGLGVRIESTGVTPPCPGRGVVELAKEAAEQCFQQSRYSRDDIDLVIFAGTYREQMLSEPAIAALLAGKLEIRHDLAPLARPTILAFDLLTGPTGFLKACLVASRLIEYGRVKTALILAAEHEGNPKPVCGPLRPIAPTGAAVILDRSPDNSRGFRKFVGLSYTEHIERRTACGNACSGRPEVLIRNDPELETHYLQCIADCLRKHGLLGTRLSSRIKFILPSQVGATFTKRLAALLGVEDDQVIWSGDDVYDLFTSSVAYCWLTLLRSNRWDHGDLVLFLNVGAGVEVSCATYRI